MDFLAPRSLPAFLAPDADFAALDAHLRTTGWERDLAGESEEDTEDDDLDPVSASWSRPVGEGEIDYSFEPEVGLRRLEVRGEDAGATLAGIAAALPVLSADDVRGLLRSADPARALLGLRIAAEMRTGALADDVIALTRHPHEVIRAHAQGVIQQAAAQVAPLASPSDPASLFSGIPDARYRRQTLRWLLRENPEPTPATRLTLAAALRDPDWEVRATAVLAAARWRSAEALPRVRAANLEPGGGLGPTRQDAVILRELRRHAEHILLGGPALDTHFYRAVAGLPVKRPDHAFLLIEALATPVPNDVPGPPAVLPPGIVRQPGGWLLEAAGLSLAWVPPVDHWLGDDLPGLLTPRRIEKVRPERGFFVADSLLPAASGEAPWTGTLDKARRLCADLAGKTGLAVRLPTADEWEMAARGPDGRIFPWGNGIEADAGRALSPWGCRDLLGKVGQWSATTDAGHPLVCGTSRQGCAPRAPRASGEAFGLRPVVG